MLGSGIGQRVVSNCIVHHLFDFISFPFYYHYYLPLLLHLTLFSIILLFLTQPTSFTSPSFTSSPFHRGAGERGELSERLRGASFPAGLKARQSLPSPLGPSGPGPSEARTPRARRARRSRTEGAVPARAGPALRPSRPIAALLPGPGRAPDVAGRRRDVDNTQTRDVGAWFPWKRTGDVIASPSRLPPPEHASAAREGRGPVAAAAGGERSPRQRERLLFVWEAATEGGRGLWRPRPPPPPPASCPRGCRRGTLARPGPGSPAGQDSPRAEGSGVGCGLAEVPPAGSPTGGLWLLRAPPPCAGRSRAGNLSREMGPGLKILPLRRRIYF
ncbi:uncharacterized protein ACIQIH_008204 isoform 1-T2 [Cyanocitta cristata]